ncbi:hypothetical protein WJX74_008858 [Apatococcus lobatus]|uniref:Uncharacterized protein n=1 Tax=Apatococcus lobatus TaxID=904363 RepID=A0AAW1SCB9_9CHLO
MALNTAAGRLQHRSRLAEGRNKGHCFWRQSMCQSRGKGRHPVCQVAAAPAAAVPSSIPGRWTGLITTVCSTLAALAAFATALILFVRPLLKRLEKLAEASEAASKSFEVASEQFEKACAMAQLDLPPAIESIERTSREFEELALHLRIMTGGKRKPSTPKAPPDPPESKENAKGEGATSGVLVGAAPSTPSRNSFQRVAQDVLALTQALEPAMNQWRQRINRIAASFEHANKNQVMARRQSHAEAASSKSSSISDPGKPAVSSDTSEADLQGQMVQSLVEDIGGTVSKAKDTMAAKADDQPMSPDTAASLIQEVVSKASTSVSTFMRSSMDADTAESSSPKAPSSFSGAAETADQIATEAGSLASSMDESDEAAEKKAELQDVSNRSKSAAKVFKALAVAEEATAAAAHASGALETAVAEARTEGPWFQRRQQNGAEDAEESSPNGKDSKHASAAKAA